MDAGYFHVGIEPRGVLPNEGVIAQRRANWLVNSGRKWVRQQVRKQRAVAIYRVDYRSAGGKACCPIPIVVIGEVRIIQAVSAADHSLVIGRERNSDAWLEVVPIHLAD